MPSPHATTVRLCPIAASPEQDRQIELSYIPSEPEEHTELEEESGPEECHNFVGDTDTITQGGSQSVQPGLRTFRPPHMNFLPSNRIYMHCIISKRSKPTTSADHNEIPRFVRPKYTI
jgi:hypothetical protein